MNPLQEQQAVFKIGVVSAIDPASCSARVRFDDLDGLETMFLPVGQKKTLKDKSYWMPDVGEHVACMLDGNAETGVILCAIYSDADAPPVVSPDKLHIRFMDGGMFEYDRASGAMTIITKGVVDVTAEGPVTVRAPSVTIDSPQTTCTGALLVEGMFTYRGGMAGSGGAGAAAVIDGNVQVDGNIDATGSVIDAGGNTPHHTH